MANTLPALNSADLWPLLPELVLAGAAFALLLFDLFFDVRQRGQVRCLNESHGRPLLYFLSASSVLVSLPQATRLSAMTRVSIIAISFFMGCTSFHILMVLYRMSGI